MTPREYGKHLADQCDPLTLTQIEAAARILATVEPLIERVQELEDRIVTLERASAPATRNQLIWLNTKQAGEYVGKHRDTLLKALESGDLHGTQRVANGRWSIHIECLNAWNGDQDCPRHP